MGSGFGSSSSTGQASKMKVSSLARSSQLGNVDPSFLLWLDWSFPVSKYISLPFLYTLTLSHHLIETWTTHPSLPLDFTDPDAA